MYQVFWESRKGDEAYSRTFDNKNYALRHGEDMHAWGYNVDVFDDEDRHLLNLRISKPILATLKDKKKGDTFKAKIIANESGHQIPIGSIVQAIWESPDCYYTKIGLATWWFGDSEIEVNND